MPRQETDKEDLIRDATALVRRAEITCENATERITIGFFADDRMAIYFSQDPFYQFDAEGQLRRAFEDGFLYRSQGTTLSRLDRHRDPPGVDGRSSTVLNRADLSVEMLDAFRERLRQRLVALTEAIRHRRFRVLRSVNPPNTLPQGTLKRLNQILNRGSDDLAPPPSPR